MLPSGTIACVRCAKQLPAAATFCDGCGARVTPHAPAGAAPVAAPLFAPGAATARPGFVAAGRGMSVCHGCGAIAPTRRSQCEVCAAPIGTSLEAIPPRDDGAYWVQVRTELVCRQCGQKSPLDPLDCDGTVSCGKCSAVQAFDPTAWEEALAHAHAVGDLGGPDLTGKNASLGGKNPFAEVGVTACAADHLVSGMVISGGVMKTRNVAISAAPGHPLCGQCGTPTAIEARANEVASRCPGCGDAARFRFPVDAMAMAPGMVGAMGDELRIDRPSAKLDATSAGAVVAVRCPSCGASLDVEQGKHFATCTYCKTHCRIPQRTLLALKRGDTRADPWWILFRGPATRRAQLSGFGPPPAAYMNFDSDDEYEPRRRKKKNLALLEQPPMARTRADELIAWALQITIPLVLLLVVGGALQGNILIKWVRGLTSTEQHQNEPR